MNDTPEKILAVVASHLLNPSMVALGVFVGLGWNSGGQWSAVAIGVLFYCIIPGTVLVCLKRLGCIDEFYPSERSRRAPLLVLGACFYFLGVPALYLSDAPHIMLAAGAVFLGNAVLAWIVNRRWKISIHAVGGGAGVVVLIGGGGTVFWPVVVTLPVVGWARWTLNCHSVMQLASGASIGSISAWSALSAAREVHRIIF